MVAGSEGSEESVSSRGGDLEGEISGRKTAVGRATTSGGHSVAGAGRPQTSAAMDKPVGVTPLVANIAKPRTFRNKDYHHGGG